jgi:hypothetical protein
MLVSRMIPVGYWRSTNSQNLGAPTYLVSPVDFATNPLSLFLTLARYKIKDTYATGQMLDYAMSSMAGKGFQLHELKNLMISTDGRPRVDVCMCHPYLYYLYGVMLTLLLQIRKSVSISLGQVLTEHLSTRSILTSSTR